MRAISTLIISFLMSAQIHASQQEEIFKKRILTIGFGIEQQLFDQGNFKKFADKLIRFYSVPPQARKEYVKKLRASVTRPGFGTDALDKMFHFLLSHSGSSLGNYPNLARFYRKLNVPTSLKNKFTRQCAYNRKKGDKVPFKLVDLFVGNFGCMAPFSQNSSAKNMENLKKLDSLVAQMMSRRSLSQMGMDLLDILFPSALAAIDVSKCGDYVSAIQMWMSKDELHKKTYYPSMDQLRKVGFLKGNNPAFQNCEDIYEANYYDKAYDRIRGGSADEEFKRQFNAQIKPAHENFLKQKRSRGTASAPTSRGGGQNHPGSDEFSRGCGNVSASYTLGPRDIDGYYYDPNNPY